MVTTRPPRAANQPEHDLHPDPPKKVLGRRLAIGFGLVSIVAVLMYALLLGLVGEVSGQILSMRQDEAAIRESLTMSTAIREQYMHQAHWILERDEAHRRHHERWDEVVRAGAKKLRAVIPASEIQHLELIQKNSAEMARLFEEEVVPAVLAGQQDRVRTLHLQIRQLCDAASVAADSLARTVEARMVSAHVSATKATNLALALGGLCVVLVLLLSVAFTLRLKQAVLRPLERLAKTAGNFGAGDFASRVGEIGEGELLSVARAFDSMAEELQQRERRLVESERMAAIGQLAAGVAHEINNPIGIIRGYLKTMGPDSKPETLQAELAILDEEAGHCQRIAEDLLSYVRMPALSRVSVDMREFLTTSVARFRESHGDTTVELQAGSGSAYADKGRLRQILFNLLQNAVQASPLDSTIEVEGAAVMDAYQITVLDRGKVIPEEDRSRIFEPFFSRRPGGSGLGLSVCQGLVKAHGGVLEVEARSGGGSLFRIHIPTARPGTEERA